MVLQQGNHIVLAMDNNCAGRTPDEKCKDWGAFVGDKLDPGHFPLDGDRIVPGNLLPVSEALGSG